jgi:hypothetical protein
MQQARSIVGYDFYIYWESYSRVLPPIKPDNISGQIRLQRFQTVLAVDVNLIGIVDYAND